ncbi:hypothetical protein ACJ73_09881 [Blastomyces percursus]|uniref:Uncharacterized protein n=1 Tax=Blastomyces percursus TaxID=1658174 RepID=A0A1J9P1L1_9EURO|nr:hypothetical protein ACJ73_09881 [Blastomyces percursus]
MANLRLGGTPDLTKDYLPTPATDRRAAPGAFELDKTIEEESNDSNIEYEDPVNDTMSDNASEETRMRLEIARLQHEVERMRTGRATEVSVDENISADLADYLQRKGRTSGIMKILNEFRDQVRPIQKPVVLAGSANYPMWKEAILLAARQSETDDILDEKQISGPNGDASPDMQRFGKERNMWLYNYIWSAIAPQAKSHFTIPKEFELSVYALWSIEDNFAERPAVRRTRLYKEMTGLNAKSKGSDRGFIERLIAIRTHYIRLGYRVEDFMFFDCLLTGVSDGWASFIKNRMDQIEKDNTQPLEKDFIVLCRDILLRLPTVEEVPPDTDSNTQDDKNTKECSYCQ